MHMMNGYVFTQNNDNAIFPSLPLLTKIFSTMHESGAFSFYFNENINEEGCRDFFPIKVHLKSQLFCWICDDLMHSEKEGKVIDFNNDNLWGWQKTFVDNLLQHHFRPFFQHNFHGVYQKVMWKQNFKNQFKIFEFNIWKFFLDFSNDKNLENLKNKS